MKTPSKLPNQNIFALTPREWEVILYIAADATNAEIADNLCITSKSIENYRTRIGDKLDLKGPHKLAKFARINRQELQQWFQLIHHKASSNPLDHINKLS